MPRSRHLAVMLVVALLACLPAVAHGQGGAGDDQYQDPFGGSTTTTQPKKPKTPRQSDDSSPTATTTAPPLTEQPNNGTSAASSSSSAAAPATADEAPAELARTGLDAPVVALLGIGLLAAGVGLRLRLRTVDGRSL